MGKTIRGESTRGEGIGRRLGGEQKQEGEMETGYGRAALSK